MLSSRYYRVGGLIKAMKGMALCQNALLPEFESFNLFERVKTLNVPVHFVQGNLDCIAPPVKGREFYEHLQAANKSYHVFEKSAHTPQYDEPAKFANVILSAAKESNVLTASK
jgi:pimeloyl-ACP methyl ester carboxylesterase